MAPDDVVAPGEDHPQQHPEHQYLDVLASLADAGLPGVCAPGADGGLVVEVALDDAQVLVVTEVAGPLPPRRADLSGWGVSVLARTAGEEPRLLAWDGAARTDVPGLMALVSAVLLDTMRGPSSAA